MSYNKDMIINAVPQFQGAMTPRGTEMADGCRALAAHASRVLDLPHTVVDLDRSTSPPLAREGCPTAPS